MFTLTAYQNFWHACVHVLDRYHLMSLCKSLHLKINSNTWKQNISLPPDSMLRPYQMIFAKSSKFSEFKMQKPEDQEERAIVSSICSSFTVQHWTRGRGLKKCQFWVSPWKRIRRSPPNVYHVTRAMNLRACRHRCDADENTKFYIVQIHTNSP